MIVEEFSGIQMLTLVVSHFLMLKSTQIEICYDVGMIYIAVNFNQVRS